MYEPLNKSETNNEDFVIKLRTFHAIVLGISHFFSYGTVYLCPHHSTIGRLRHCCHVVFRKNELYSYDAAFFIRGWSFSSFYPGHPRSRNCRQFFCDEKYNKHNFHPEFTYLVFCFCFWVCHSVLLNFVFGPTSSAPIKPSLKKIKIENQDCLYSNIAVFLFKSQDAKS